MIFLFFGSSIAHLEPKLQRLKDRVWLLPPVWLKLQQILTDLQTAVTRVLDEQWRIQKKGKSSEFDAEDDDYIKSGPAVKV